MFTGIVEHVGRVVAVERTADLTRFRIDLGPIAAGVKLGDSIAVLGVCLTVTRIDGTLHDFEAIPETLSRTRLGRLAAGDAVNLERAMSAGARLDGHIVQGHVDGLGVVESLARSGNEVLLHVRVREPEAAGEADESLADAIVGKGSIAIDGVSLTVVRAEGARFHVALIPHTLAHTTLGGLCPGDCVHLEVDVFAKYLKRHLDRVLPGLVAAALAARDDAAKT
ncbi:MAG: riboflavin synthase [Deltaproteobacteria bacterium]|nr:riboflavin synthase [Deltaproteobacteria bacterium]